MMGFKWNMAEGLRWDQEMVKWFKVLHNKNSLYADNGFKASVTRLISLFRTKKEKKSAQSKCAFVGNVALKKKMNKERFYRH